MKVKGVPFDQMKFFSEISRTVPKKLQIISTINEKNSQSVSQDQIDDHR